MIYLIFILIPLILLVVIFFLTEYEARHGVRLFALKRARLDTSVERVEFVLSHVDFKSFAQDIAQRVAHRIMHDIAHFSLLAVRSVERFLTHIVQHLRSKRAIDAPPRESTREFVKTLSDFKDKLKETPPEIPDIY